MDLHTQVFEYSLSRGIEEKHIRLSLFDLENGYMKKLTDTSWKIISRYFVPQPTII